MPADAEPVIDPRWSLANERTLLAYTRTALAFIVAGLAIAGSRAVADTPRWLAAFGLPFIVVGSIIALEGRQRFVHTEAAMLAGENLSMPRLALRLSVVLSVLALAGLVIATIQVVDG